MGKSGGLIGQKGRGRPNQSEGGRKKKLERLANDGLIGSNREPVSSKGHPKKTKRVRSSEGTGRTIQYRAGGGEANRCLIGRKNRPQWEKGRKVTDRARMQASGQKKEKKKPKSGEPPGGGPEKTNALQRGRKKKGRRRGGPPIVNSARMFNWGGGPSRAMEKWGFSSRKRKKKKRSKKNFCANSGRGQKPGGWDGEGSQKKE